MRRVVTCLLAVFVTALVGTAVAPARAADVHGDDERDVYVGTGGLLLPGSVDVGERRRVAECGECRWRLTSICAVPDRTLGSGFDDQRACTSVVRGCPNRQRTLRAWFQAPGRSWRPIDVVCVGRPVTVEQVGAAVTDRVEDRLPALTVTTRPARGAITQLPVRFDAGQPAEPSSWTMPILDRTVEVVAVPTWTWTFGDETVGESPTADRSGPTPAHTYRRAGPMTVTVRTTWSATFRVDGLGPFAVPQTLHQVVTFALPIGQGRALLVDSR